jgi:hypothetical protein
MEAMGYVAVHPAGDSLQQRLVDEPSLTALVPLGGMWYAALDVLQHSW